MKLKSFRIYNYKSIIDSGECRLSDHDNITVLAGQNESGKSSILQALRDFHDDDINVENLRDGDDKPKIVCTFHKITNEFKGENFLEDIDVLPAVKNYVKSLKEITIIKYVNDADELIMTSDSFVVDKIRQILEQENENLTDTNNRILAGTAIGEQSLTWNVEESIEEVLNEIFYLTPTIIFFDDFCDLLPDQILVSDLKSTKDVKGLEAVKNVEIILGADFSKLDTISDGKRETTQATYHETITAQFNEKWKQRIAEGTGAKVHVKHYRDATGVSYLKFYIETKKGEYLPVGKRSQGFKWFLSFYLQLKAEDKEADQLIILFDEPGLYLHSKAQLDMITVFEELSDKCQIIYSTHSPYLIDATKLHRLKLILNTKEQGTTIEKITTSKIRNQKEALKPIIDALGLEIASPFALAEKNNVILEGISDFHYFQAFMILLNKNYKVAFLPSMGSPNCHLLMELCIGWGLNWIILFDDKGATSDYNKIKRSFFGDNEDLTSKRIFKLKDCDGIEDMLSVKDMKLVNPDAKFIAETKNSIVVKEYGGKELYSRLFYEKVLNGNINKENVSALAVKNFERVFSFIEKAFNLK